MSRLIVAIALIFSPMLALAEFELQLLPDTVSEGADVNGIVRGDSPSSPRALRISGVDDRAELLVEFETDSAGRGAFQGALSEFVPPGVYDVLLYDEREQEVLETTTLTVTPAPTIRFDRRSGFGGTEVGVTFQNLVPGVVEFYLDDVPVIGARAVSDSAFSTTVVIPRGSAGTITASLVNRVGQRITGVGTAILERRAQTMAAPELPTLRWPARFGPSDIIEITGELQVPEGTRVTDYDWTTVWITRDGRQFPVNTRPLEFDLDGEAPDFGEPVAFSVNVALPSMQNGFPPAERDQLDELGFVYTNPSTGQSGRIVHPAAATGLDDEAGITITGRLVEFDPDDDDPNPDLTDNAPIVGAIWNVTAKTELIEPNTQIPLPDGKAAATETTVNTLAAGVHGNNQLTAVTEANETPTGCPVTLDNGVTDENGEFQFAFSPFLTDLLRIYNTKISATAGGAVEYIPPKNPPLDEFLIRLSALLQGFGIPVGTQNGNALFGGIRYEFKREFDATYNFRTNFRAGDPRDPDPPIFDQPFDPRETLISVMAPVDVAQAQELPSTPYIEELAAALPRDGQPARFSKIIAFPSLRGTDLDNEAITLVLPWSGRLFGTFEEDVVVSLDGQTIGTMSSSAGIECAVAGSFRINLTGLATWDLAGQQSAIVPGRIDTVSETGAAYFKEFEILIEQGPTWWQDASRWENASVSWSPEIITIRADEKANKMSSATAPEVPKDVGKLENDNMEVATVTQTLRGGQVSGTTRNGVTDQVVANQPAGAKVVARTRYTSGTSVRSTELLLLEQIGTEVLPKSVVDLDCNGEETVACLRRRLAEGESPSSGSATPITILDTGKIPLFRYAWGVPPIAALTVGADIWFRAVLNYFMFVETASASIDVDGLVEPEVTGGLDVFLDLSALFGIVSGRLTAAPAVGVAMPVVVSDTQFNAMASQPCFNFVMDLFLQVSLGPCPLCAKLNFSERAIDYAERAGCVVAGLNPKGTAPEGPAAGKLALATDNFGTATGVFATDQGIQALNLQGGTPGNLQSLDSGPGAMRPAAAFFDVGKGMAVWAQSSLDPFAFAALPDQTSDDPCHDDPSSSFAQTVAGADNCSAMGPGRLPGTEFQHMVYALLENDTWGPTLDLTLPTTGEGGVELAACMDGDAGCPAGGEILAVWEIDTAMDLNEQRIKLRYARYSGARGTWSEIETIDPGSSAKDVQAEPLYVRGDPSRGISAEPVITWVRNPMATRGNLNLQERELWYEFVDHSAGPQQAIGLPAGVSSPSADDFSDRSFAVAFAQSADTTFFGNRRALWIARARDCMGGICTWTTNVPTDEDRRLFVENPSIVIDDLDRVTVTGRQLGLDGALTGLEAIGVVTGTGDLFRYSTTLADLSVGSSTALSDDGAVNWQPEAVFDPVTNNFMVLSAKGIGVEQLAKARLGKNAAGIVARPVAGVMSKGLTGSTGVFLSMQEQGPDGVVTAASATETVLEPGGRVEVEVSFENRGIDFGGSVELAAFWDGPNGVGERTILTRVRPDDGPATTVLSVAVPRTFSADEPHTLYVTLNPDLAAHEVTLENNTATVDFGAMPVPFDIAPSVDAAGTIAFLDWSVEEDERVTGFRIYRRELGSDVIYSVGYSPVDGFADLNVIPGTVYEYRVASLSDNMMESDPSAWVAVGVNAIRSELLFSDSFETRFP
ncbi:MAG: hypothetical protein AAGE01_05675 [Pseudomonadota bacterium]